MEELLFMEAEALKKFAASRDPTHLLVLADRCQEDGRSAKLHFEALLRGVAASDARLLDACAWFVTNHDSCPSGYSTGDPDNNPSPEDESGPQWLLRSAARLGHVELWARANALYFQVHWEEPFSPPGVWQCIVDGFGKGADWEAYAVGAYYFEIGSGPVRDEWFNLHYYPLGEPKLDSPRLSSPSAQELRPFMGRKSYPPKQRWAEAITIEGATQLLNPNNPVHPVAPYYPDWLLPPCDPFDKHKRAEKAK